MSEPRTEAGRMLSGLNRSTFPDGLAEAFDPSEFDERIRSIEAEAGSLDAAWAEAEAALPEGWHLSVDTGSGKPRAHACPARFGADPQVNADCPTPAAALLALAARLRETTR